MNDVWILCSNVAVNPSTPLTLLSYNADALDGDFSSAVLRACWLKLDKMNFEVVNGTQKNLKNYWFFRSSPDEHVAFLLAIESQIYDL